MKLLLLATFFLAQMSESAEVPQKVRAEMIRSPSNENTNIKSFPFMGSYGYYAPPLKKNWVNVCAAAVVSKRALMTAGHCFKYFPQMKKQVLLGQTELNSEDWSATRLEINISNVVAHPNYNNKSAYCDIGIIYTDKDIIFNNAIQPILLSDKPAENIDFLLNKEREVGLVGWADPSKTKTKETKLKYTPLTIYSNDYCDDKYHIKGDAKIADERKTMLPSFATGQTICAGSSIQDVGSCKGDSGTPLFEYIYGDKPQFVARGVLHGSIGNCGNIDFPSVFANLADKQIWQFLKDQDIDITYISVDKDVSENLNAEYLRIIVYVLAGVLIAVFVIISISCVYFLTRILKNTCSCQKDINGSMLNQSIESFGNIIDPNRATLNIRQNHQNERVYHAYLIPNEEDTQHQPLIESTDISTDEYCSIASSSSRTVCTSKKNENGSNSVSRCQSLPVIGVLEEECKTNQNYATLPLKQVNKTVTTIERKPNWGGAEICGYCKGLM